MPFYICATCGVQYPDSDTPPEHCPICEDERQYVGYDGQKWTTLDEMRPVYQNVVQEEEPHLYGIGTTPKFAIGQRALLVQSASGNVLWDSITYIDDKSIETVRQLGGISAMAISHPHYYSSMIEWSKAFGSVPIYIHEGDHQWVVRPDPVVHFWQGETLNIGDGLTLIRGGGHFDGSSMLHWAQGADGRGALLTGDTIYVVQDRHYVSFMYSFPNLIPLSPKAVEHVINMVRPYDYDRVYSAWFGNVVKANGKASVEFSAQRYIKAVQGE